MRYGPYVVPLLIVAIGCGSNATKGTGGGGGVGGAGGRGGGGGVPAICAKFACLQTVQDLMAACTVGGACISQNDLDSTPITIARCYDSGIHVLTTSVITRDATNYTSTGATQVKKDADLCYTRSFMDVTPMQPDAGPIVSMDITTLDPSGTLVATVHVDANLVKTVTCPGSPPAVLPDSCGVSPFVISGSYFEDANAPDCTSGTCSF
jgi:hypothetical protein